MPTCSRCGEPARGFATINGERYCHSDERSCYTEQHREDTWADTSTADTSTVLSIASENAVRWREALALLAQDWKPDPHMGCADAGCGPECPARLTREEP